MTENSESPDPRSNLPANHEEFLELCALAASGNLSEPEQAKLREHLAACPQCRTAFDEFQTVVEKIAPELGERPEQDAPANPSFSQEMAEESFQKRLKEEREKERKEATGETGGEPGSVARVSFGDGKGFERGPRYELWLPLAATIVLSVTLGVLSYRTGRTHGIEWARATEDRRPMETASKEPPITVHAGVPPGDEDLAARDAVLAELRQEIARKTVEVSKLKALQAEQEARLVSSSQDRKQLGEEKNELAGERDRLRQEVLDEEAALHVTQERLKRIERERSDYVLHAASLEKRISELDNRLEERERQTAEQQALLAKDQDIRELIGARELYITEIYDVDHNGDHRKAAGRVFYTKGKSLIFYAYDLKGNSGVTDASTFEAWGQRGSDWRQASKLGLFYEDNATKKRWVVKSNDRKALEQIDAVFITIEPNGGSERPTGKPMLFAYLKMPPNHP